MLVFQLIVLFFIFGPAVAVTLHAIFWTTVILCISINQLVGYISQNLPSDWLSYSLSIGDRPPVAKWIDFQLQNNVRKRTFFRDFSKFQFKIMFCPTSWFILKQSDNLPSLSMNDNQLGRATLTICSQTTRTRRLIANYIMVNIYIMDTCSEHYVRIRPGKKQP